MKVKELLGDGYTVPVETNDVIRAMLNKVAKELFYDNHYSQGYEAITKGGTPLGNKVNEVFFLEQKEQTSMFGGLENNISGSISDSSINIQASCLLNEHEIKRAVRDDLDLQDIYDRMLKNLRTSLLLQRRKAFLNSLTDYMNNNNLKVLKGSKLSDIASITRLGFQVPSSDYNVSDKEIQCFDGDIICLTDFKKLGLMLNEHDNPFISWLQYNSIIEKTLPANVNKVTVNPDMVMFDRRALKILVNDSQFTYFFDPNSLTHTITYTENIIIATNPIANVCVLKEEQKPNSMGKSYMLETTYSYYTLNQFIPYTTKGYEGTWIITNEQRPYIDNLNIGDTITLVSSTKDKKMIMFNAVILSKQSDRVKTKSTGFYLHSDQIIQTLEIPPEVNEEEVNNGEVTEPKEKKKGE